MNSTIQFNNNFIQEIMEFYNTARVLLVDDEKDLLDVTRSNLLDNLKHVYVAKNGREALSIVKDEDIDIAVIDLKMPVMNGFELLNELKNLHNDVVSCVMSGNEDKNSIKRGFKLGAVDYLEKPVATKDLLNKIFECWKIKCFREKEKKSVEDKFIELNFDLKKQVDEKNRTDIALNEILNNLKKDKNQLNENILLNLEKNVKPLLIKIKDQIKGFKDFDNVKVLNLLNLLENELDSINSDFYKKIFHYKYMLSPAETKICKLIHSGMIMKEVAAYLSISENTVKNHVKNIKKKMGITGTSSLKDCLNKLTI